MVLMMSHIFGSISEQYRNLSAEQAFLNADSYAQFAFDVIGKPDFSIVQ